MQSCEAPNYNSNALPPDSTGRQSRPVQAALPLPYTYVYLAIPVGIVSMLLSYVSAIPKYSIKYKKGEL